jgi:ankyrin repeat protein
MIKLLLDTGKIDVNAKGNNGQAPLSRAARSRSKAAAILLLAKLLAYATV